MEAAELLMYTVLFERVQMVDSPHNREWVMV